MSRAAQTIARIVVLSVLGLPLLSCTSSRSVAGPSIEFTRLPSAGEGSSAKTESIEGRVKGARRGQRIVLFARSGVWWVQPFEARPFTEIQADSTWRNVTHPGSAYAALLVDDRYRPPATVEALPEKGGAVLAIATAEGNQLVRPETKKIYFSGYEWQIRQTPNDQGGTLNNYDPENVRVDSQGFLHLQIKRENERWTSAEVSLTRSLGYGLYRFVIHEVSHLEPSVTFSMSTWDDYGPSREMDIEVGRWGEAGSKNAQYVVQPYYVPSNVFRFMAPAGGLTFSLQWEPGQASFQTQRGSGSNAGSKLVSEHLFTSGVPPSGKETVRMSLYVYENQNSRLQRDTEVIVEKFEYLP